MSNEIICDDVEMSLLARLNESFSNTKFIISERRKRFSYSNDGFTCDIIISIPNDDSIALFVIQRHPEEWTRHFKQSLLSRRFFGPNNIRYFIITDGDSFWASSDGGRIIQKDYDEIVVAIKSGIPILGQTPSVDDIYDAFSSSADSAHLKQSNAILSFIKKPRKRSLFQVDASNGRICFSTMSAEDSFFSLLLNGKIPRHLCRYTTRHNFFLFLKEKKQNMCSIVCMNDRSEENYADMKIGLNSSDNSSLFDNNNCFIMSLLPANKADDLTMWRLYGDDAKGVCVNYINEVRQRGRRIKGGFYISSISYGKDDVTHPELDFIKNLLNNDINNWRFSFNRWEIWKHFFKSYLFRDENEVRLLYLSNGDCLEEGIWIENDKSGIVSKMLLFPINLSDRFPLRVNDAIIGPKSPEPKKIAEQFSYMVSQELGNDSAISIRESSIKEYR